MVAERAAHQVVVADRGAAGGHQQVRAARAFGHRRQRFAVVGDDAERQRLAAAGGDEGGERQAVGADDLARRDRLARHHHLVAGGEDGDARPARHAQPRPVHRCRQADVAGGEAAALGEAELAGGEVEPGRAHIGAGRGALAHGDRGAGGVDILLDDDGVGAGRQRGAGEDANRLARADPAVEAASGGNLADDREPRQNRYNIGAAHGVAIHRRDRGRRGRRQ